MGSPRLISIVGRKDAGKTTLLVALAAEFGRKGMRVATLKHGHHPALADKEGKDTWRHYNEGRAVQTMIESPGQRVLYERTESEEDPVTLIRRYMSGADIVLIEGFKKYPLPKIEAHRAAVGAPLCVTDPDLPGEWVALVTDQRNIRVGIPIMRFTDTSWIYTLVAQAQSRAVPLDTLP